MCTPRSIEPSPFGRRTLITLERPIKNHTRSKSPPSPCAATSKFDLAITKIGLIYHFNCNKKLIFSTGVDEGIAPRQCNLDRVTFGRRVHQGSAGRSGARVRGWNFELWRHVVKAYILSEVSVGARGEHSRSDAESGRGAARAGDGTKSISSGGARRLAPSPRPSNE